jgi:hypothetical protein
MTTLNREEFGMQRIGGRGAVAVTEDELLAAYPVVDARTATEPGVVPSRDTSGLRVLVEYLRITGEPVRALLGARYQAGPSTVEFVVDIGVAWDIDAVGTCPGVLFRAPFVAGLPPNFADAALTGLTSDETPLPAGRYTIDRAGYDVVNSSERSVEICARALRAVLGLRLGTADEDAVRRALAAYP